MKFKYLGQTVLGMPSNAFNIPYEIPFALPTSFSLKGNLLLSIFLMKFILFTFSTITFPFTFFQYSLWNSVLYSVWPMWWISVMTFQYSLWNSVQVRHAGLFPPQETFNIPYEILTLRKHGSFTFPSSYLSIFLMKFAFSKNPLIGSGRCSQSFQYSLWNSRRCFHGNSS